MKIKYMKCILGHRLITAILSIPHNTASISDSTHPLTCLFSSPQYKRYGSQTKARILQVVNHVDKVVFNPFLLSDVGLSVSRAQSNRSLPLPAAVPTSEYPHCARGPGDLVLQRLH